MSIRFSCPLYYSEPPKEPEPDMENIDKLFTTKFSDEKWKDIIQTIHLTLLDEILLPSGDLDYTVFQVICFLGNAEIAEIYIDKICITKDEMLAHYGLLEQNPLELIFAMGQYDLIKLFFKKYDITKEDILKANPKGISILHGICITYTKHPIIAQIFKLLCDTFDFTKEDILREYTHTGSILYYTALKNLCDVITYFINTYNITYNDFLIVSTRNLLKDVCLMNHGEMLMTLLDVWNFTKNDIMQSISKKCIDIPFHIMCFQGKHQIIQRFIDTAYIDPNTGLKTDYITHEDIIKRYEGGLTALYIACRFDNTHTVKLLIDLFNIEKD